MEYLRTQQKLERTATSSYPCRSCWPCGRSNALLEAGLVTTQIEKGASHGPAVFRRKIRPSVISHSKTRSPEPTLRAAGPSLRRISTTRIWRLIPAIWAGVTRMLFSEVISDIDISQVSAAFDTPTISIAMVAASRIRTVDRPLTVKLSGRPQPPNQRRGRILFPSARGAEPPTHHGPLPRLLGVALGRDAGNPKVFTSFFGMPEIVLRLLIHPTLRTRPKRDRQAHRHLRTATR